MRIYMKKYESILHKINNQKKLSREETFEGMLSLIEEMDPSHLQMQMGLILFGISVRGVTVDETLGLWDFVKEVDQSLLKRKLVANVNGPVIGLSGSGKKGIKTFNISTASALIAATAGAYISKPVSRATSSMTGSSDLLEIAGAFLNIQHEQMLGVLEVTGFGAFSIENTIPKFDSIYGGKFYVSHALSPVLAAMANPVNCGIMLHGLSNREIKVSAQALKSLGIKSGSTFCSTDSGTFYVDELTTLKHNYLAFWNEEGDVIETSIDVPRFFGCKVCDADDLRPGINKQYQLQIFLDSLSVRSKTN